MTHIEKIRAALSPYPSEHERQAALAALADLAAAVAERDALKGDAVNHIESYRTMSANFARTIAERDTLRARLAAIYGAPAIARIESLPGPRGGAYLYIMGVESPPNMSSGTDLIARPAKD